MPGEQSDGQCKVNETKIKNRGWQVGLVEKGQGQNKREGEDEGGRLMQREMLEGRGVYAGGGDKNIWFCFLDMMRNKSSHSRNICQTNITLTKKRRRVRGEE